MALLKLGKDPIQSITDRNSASAIALNVAWEISVRELARMHDWGCLKKRAQLAQVVFDNTVDSSSSITVTPWVPNTAYAVNAYVSFGVGIYCCLIAYTSSSNFTDDLTQGYWYQTDLFTGADFSNGGSGSTGLYEWSYCYQLPEDFILLNELNGTDCAHKYGNGNLYEIYQDKIFCNTTYADVKYIAYVTNTTLYDSLFISALAILLAANVATTLRKDSGETAARLRAELVSDYLPKADARDANQRKMRRYSPVLDSRFVKSRWYSTNG